MALSIVLPCYNPQQGWERGIVQGYNAFCSRIAQPAELVLVLDGKCESVKDAQLNWLRSEVQPLKIVRYPDNMGKGYAVRQGVGQATGDIIIYSDVDFPYTVASMEAVYNELVANNCDVAVGVKDDQYYSHLGPVRRFISRYLRFLVSTFLAMPITDTQCGLKGFRVPVKTLFLQTTINRYLFDLEFIRNCFSGNKFRVKAVPVTLNEQVHFRKMNYSILFPEMLNFVKLLFKKPNG